MTDPIETRQTQIEALLNDVVLARLATTKNNQPHVVPVWFLWDGQSVWISAFTSTRKVKELLKNPRCAVLIEPKELETGKIQAVLFEGTADLIDQPRALVEEMSLQIYTRYLGPEGVLTSDPQSWIHDPENRIIKLTPENTYSW
jgi:nitroimidazol reductase NimA-like FMN-containing flavoprotein (pyridoxamine 5'-phosphate oxidase superfamily)